MPAFSSAGSSSPLRSAEAERTRRRTAMPIRSSCSRAVRPSGPGPPSPCSRSVCNPATRIMKNSSRLLWKMARNFTRSSRGQRGSAASSSTRSLKASQDSSRESKREPSGTVATLVSGTLTAPSIVVPLSSAPNFTQVYHGAFMTSEWILASASGGRIGPARRRPEVDEEIPGVGRRNAGRLRRTHRVLQRLEVIAVLPGARGDASELPEHADEVRLTAQRESQGEPRRGAERGDAEVLAVQHGLGLHQLLVEA